MRSGSAQPIQLRPVQDFRNGIGDEPFGHDDMLVPSGTEPKNRRSASGSAKLMMVRCSSAVSRVL
jgi:hypothetical protein